MINPLDEVINKFKYSTNAHIPCGYEPVKNKRIQTSCCLLCRKTISEIGGKRIATQKTLGTYLSNMFRGGGDPTFPEFSIKLNESTFIVLYGIKDIWTKNIITKVKEAYLNNEHPWFCQKCAGKVCQICGQILNHPVGSNVIYENGSMAYVPALGYNPGCVYYKCSNFRERESK